METDLGAPLFEGLRPNGELEPEPERPPTPPQQQHHHNVQQEHPQWDHMQYYMAPPPPQPISNPNKRDIFSDMDRTSYVFIFIAFVLGFFIGRGMVQPILFKSSS